MIVGIYSYTPAFTYLNRKLNFVNILLVFKCLLYLKCVA